MDTNITYFYNAKWRDGSAFKANANLVASEIQSIGNEVTTDQIVELAKDETTELHKCFEWDDTIAANKYRKYQARKIMVSLIIEENFHKDEGKNEEKKEYRLMYKTDNTEGYKPIYFIMKRPDEYKKLLDRAFAELQNFKRKYESLSELKDIFDLIDSLSKTA